MRRILFLNTVLSGLLAAVLPAAAGPSLLLDTSSGQVIESQDPFARWYPASLTKLMTTYVVFRAVQSGEVTMESPVRMTKTAAKEPPSKMGYKPGTILTFDAALKIIMVKSANDVAAAIGDSLAGSQAGFAARMNAEAARLGMTGSHWVNAHGLHDDNQYTTARDLAVLATALRTEFPQYASYFSIEGLAVDGKAIASHNTMIGRFEGADGMKTGYTCPSGFNLVASATRNGRTLMAVVIGATSVASRAEQAAGMLVRGFAFPPSTGGMSLKALTPPAGSPTQVTNMSDQLCSKEARAKLAKQEKERIAKDEDEDTVAAKKSIYLGQLTRPRQLVEIKLGGASGPVPKGVAMALAAENRSDVPLPSWRPDLPPPAGAEPMIVQGDSASIQ